MNMKKHKRPGGAKPDLPPEDQDEALADKLFALALDLREIDIYETVQDELKKKQAELRKIIKKCLHQQREGALDEALERCREEDAQAYGALRTQVEDLSENIVFRRDQGPDLEVNAFVIPLFVHTRGGLRPEQCFQDEDAFEQLRASFQEGELESRKANVVLVSHAYHPDEIGRIGYSQLSAMVHEAFDAMTRKKASAAEAIARSMSGWPEPHFAPEDSAVELRFLLGFTLKTLDDPFYQVPQKEAAADRYFEARAERFRRWTERYAPLVKRCLVTDGRAVEIDFLYQDLFHGGTATGIAEYHMLGMMSELQQALAAHGITPQAAQAVIGPNAADDGAILRVNLHAQAEGALLAAIDKPMAAGRNVQAEVDDVIDALRTIGVENVVRVREFDIGE
jgi:hypothetical protein